MPVIGLDLTLSEYTSKLIQYLKSESLKSQIQNPNPNSEYNSTFFRDHLFTR